MNSDVDGSAHALSPCVNGTACFAYIFVAATLLQQCCWYIFVYRLNGPLSYLSKIDEERIRSLKGYLRFKKIVWRITRLTGADCMKSYIVMGVGDEFRWWFFISIIPNTRKNASNTMRIFVLKRINEYFSNLLYCTPYNRCNKRGLKLGLNEYPLMKDT